MVSAVALGVILTASDFWSLVAIAVVSSAQVGFWPIAQAAVVDTLPTELQSMGSSSSGRGIS